MSANTAKTAEKTLKVNEAKWTKELMRAGWTVLPNVLFENQSNLGLDPLDVNILLHIASYWWEPEGKPHPSKVTIANAINVNPRTVQRRIAAMEKAKYIRRQQRRIKGEGSKSNIYHLDGLIEAAKPFAQEKYEKMQQRAEERAARAKRRGPPKLHVVKSDD
jgi:DNA-binding transcriptional regulator YhcF (GntR family)